MALPGYQKPNTNVVGVGLLEILKKNSQMNLHEEVKKSKIVKQVFSMSL